MLYDDYSSSEDQKSQAEKLEKYSGDVNWSYLRPHFEAGNMIYVDPSLQLKEVGLVFANDKKAQVRAWLKSGDLIQPGKLHADYWEKESTRFHSMIVRPFVLAQPLL